MCDQPAAASLEPPADGFFCPNKHIRKEIFLTLIARAKLQSPLLGAEESPSNKRSMIMQTLQDKATKTATAADTYSDLPTESLPFTVRLVQNEADLDKVLTVRQAAYDRHVPELAQSLGTPDQCDYDPGTVVLLAESKLDGEPLGTMRIQTNRYQPLLLERSVTLPDWLQGPVLSEATRLGVAHSEVGRMVKVVLFKAYYRYCIHAGVEWMVIAGRAPMDQQYEVLMFQEVFPGQGFIPMKHAGNLPHRVLAIEVARAEPLWRQAKHPLYDFVFRTSHPDIQIDPAKLTGLSSEADGKDVDSPHRLQN